MKKTLGLLTGAALSAALALTGLAAPARAADFVNGSFETGDFTGWTAHQRWAVIGGGTDGSFEADTPCSGAPCTDPADTGGNAKLGQLLSGLTAGSSYTVSFDARSNGTTPNELDLYVDGALKLNLTNFAASYSSYSFDFTALGTTADFAVYGRNDPYISEVDNFRLSDAGAVPEPATWALMLGGFGLAGAALRRRRSGLAFSAT